MDTAMPKTEAQWQAEDDARTLAQAEVIKQDQARLANARNAAAKIAAREREEANAMSKVAGRAVKSNDPNQKEKKGKSGYNVFEKI